MVNMAPFRVRSAILGKSLKAIVWSSSDARRSGNDCSRAGEVTDSVVELCPTSTVRISGSGAGTGTCVGTGTGSLACFVVRSSMGADGGSDCADIFGSAAGAGDGD